MTVRSLFVTHTFPWPPEGGGAIRASHTIESLASLGPVDVVCILAAKATTDRAVPPEASVKRMLLLARPPRTTHGWRRVPWMVTGRLPSMRIADYGAIRSRFAAWAGDYDIAWLGCGTEAFVALDSVLSARTSIVANLDDIEDRKIESRRTSSRLPCADGGFPPSWLARRAARMIDGVEIRRWQRLHVQIADSVDRLVVTSDIDRQALAALGISNATVVPNVYPAPARSAGQPNVGSPPTLSLVGTLHYAPNADAARFMVGCVMPGLRLMLPDVQLRLVGQPDRSTAGLVRPGVVATGWVDDVTAELSRADVAVVPVRYGSGTRIKILEAFANRIPVVSTTIGAEGLDVANGCELLIADDPARFAAACFEAVTDAELRQRLVANAYAHWDQNHRPDVLRDHVTRIVGELVDGASPRR